MKERLFKAEEKYCDQMHEWLTNPKNEDLPSEVVESNIKAAFNEFLEQLLLDENECAKFISRGNIMGEMEFMPIVFEHFKSEKIYEAIKSNCEVAFSHKDFTESEECERERREMLLRLSSSLGKANES